MKGVLLALVVVDGVARVRAALAPGDDVVLLQGVVARTGVKRVKGESEGSRERVSAKTRVFPRKMPSVDRLQPSIIITHVCQKVNEALGSQGFGGLPRVLSPRVVATVRGQGRGRRTPLPNETRRDAS